MIEEQRLHWVILLTAALLVGCQPRTVPPQIPTTMPAPSVSPTLLPSHTSVPTSTPTLPLPQIPTPTPALSPSPTPVASTTELSLSAVWPPSLTLPYTPTGDDGTGRIRGRLFFPSQYVPSLAVYAIATDGSRFYRVDTEIVPPGEPSYEIPAVEPGTYYVYGYPSDAFFPLGGVYSYLAACDAGHFAPPAEGCWEDPQHAPAPVEVRAGQAVEEVDVFDWYGPPLPPPPDDTGG